MHRWIVVILLFFCSTSLMAQSNIREGNNSFARYSSSKEMKHLLDARKFSDAAYQTRRDSASFRTNLLRALVYSTLSVVDSNRSQKYPSDPIDMASASFRIIQDGQYDAEIMHQLNYIQTNIINAYLFQAGKAVKENKNEEAFKLFSKIDSIAGGKLTDVSHNLAVLGAKIGEDKSAAGRLERLLADKELARPVYVLELADVYDRSNDKAALLKTLLSGRKQFPKNKEILFRLINVYVGDESYSSILPLIEEALSFDAENLAMLYIAGFAHEKSGNRELAIQYYERLVQLNPRHFEGNLELGLIYLKSFKTDPTMSAMRRHAEEYLLIANQIQPSNINALKSLAILYTQSGDKAQLEKVNSMLHQLIIN